MAAVRERGFHCSTLAKTFRRLTRFLSLIAAFGLAIFPSGARTKLPLRGRDAAAVLAPAAAIHLTYASAEEAVESESETVARSEDAILPSAPTRSSFMAAWTPVKGAGGYRLDVSTSPKFDTFLEGYRDLDVGNVSGRLVTQLKPGATYHYRVRAYSENNTSDSSHVASVTTSASSGLIINASFDSSITSNPNAAAIEACINRAIGIFESLLSDPITVSIRFRFAPPGRTGHRWCQAFRKVTS